MLLMEDLDLEGRRVLVREDLNVPLGDGRITNERRIVAALPTLTKALDAGAAVLVMSHLGRPKEGEPDSALSLKPVARRLGELLHIEARLATDWLDGVDIDPGELVLCENVRFNVGEKKNDESLAKRMAALCDVFVMDAFGTAHRAQASTEGVARFAPVACAGPLLAGELDALARALDNPARPLVALVGGSKVSTKLAVLDALSQKVDRLVVGGGIANTFIAAAGFDVGKSLYEQDRVVDARALLERGKTDGASIPVPTDVVVATKFAEDAQGKTKPVGDVAPNEMILDIGPDSAQALATIMKGAGTIVWNGPVGVFEFPAFAAGTRTVSTAIANSNAFSVAGGGDTLAALDQFGLGDDISYISTGGGAFLEYLQGKELPAVAVLKDRAAAG